MGIAVITGASSGMGKECALEVIKKASAYDEIWLIARRGDRLEKVKARFKTTAIRPVSLDLCDTMAMDNFFESLKEEKPVVDLLIHCAGCGIYGTIDEVSLKEQRAMMDLNCRGVTEITYAFLPYLSEEARLIYFASAAAFLPQPGFSIYAASKAFCLSYVRALRAENKKKKWKITAVCPGAVNTEFMVHATKDHPLPAYKKAVMADPGAVVKQAFKDNEKNKELSVYGLSMKGFLLLTKLLPHRIFLKFI